jgi:tRNA (guanine-N7-)-methyltransferase
MSKNATTMTGDSKPVSSSQPFCHPGLGRQVLKHLQEKNRRPPASHTRKAFESIRDSVEKAGRPLIFDSFCGTGMSTAVLAERYPQALVIGIDKSSHRLGRHQQGAANNYLLTQADCGDFWRLAVQANWQLEKHFLLYPNPWPKPGHLKRRVHGSPELVELLALGGEIELRSNWQVYVEEFGAALVLSGQYPHINQLGPDEPMSLFERKYLLSGHQLWRCYCQLVHNRPS